MTRWVTFILACCVLLILPGCWDQRELERQTISLVYGYDIDGDDQLIVYQMSPIFSKNAKKKYEVYGSKVYTTRQARDVFNASSNGIVSTGKLQALLLSENFLKKEGAMPYMDVWYRDPKNTGNMRIIAVKGSVSSIMQSEFKDKPILPQYLTNLIDVNESYNHTDVTTIDEFHRESFNEGITPAITEMKKGKDELVVTGTALLTDRGVYKLSLDRRESALLLMLQKKEELPVSLTMQLPSASLKKSNFLKNIKGRDFVTVDVTRLNRNISTGHDGSHFTFDVKMTLDVSITERTFNMDTKKNKDKLAAIISEQIGKDLNGLITKVQKQKLDPVGFGDYARAFRYQQWKKVKNHWPDEFSKATVTVKPSVKIIEYGVIK
ncbi:Ger(x)C family spore germination protein [Aneurinibacillus sp. Ricciae_BoGa-3]|uniref:Ger(x)C family spore germination protein n=1 Tax=Aneurinibacillus sp. Ricciae_BoGa-3 TaxID=3022697 RepID=UPI002340F2B6|nr:Ger(x)C family spore germination protein [Aneurinibacillus sp. Ricciae_BoGa-3]WCK55632.1 Ger(x)C family spore germination protein [Aneurinibacillus sp. Ricciae_BoGa-3]